MTHAINYDQIAAAYARNRHIHPHVLEKLCESLFPTSTVLEVGCGTGNYIVAIESITECTCWGIEPSQAMLGSAKSRSSTIRFRRSSAEKLDAPDETFDLVFSVDVIQHVADCPAAIGEAHRVLKRGGKLCTVTDSAWVIGHRQPLTTYFPETVPFELARYPRIAGLRNFMAGGFDEIVDHTVEWTYDLEDARAYREKAFSALHLIPEQAFQDGLARMEHDLEKGPIRCVSRYTMVWGKKR
ncbi:MAG: methyltransferase domain-containing protein [Anaerolineae bacterium]|nr:methyltransferase domain-containing protein [Anaerolineae bacterium]